MFREFGLDLQQVLRELKVLKEHKVLQVNKVLKELRG
jgi:hypothetical protein